MQKSSSRVNFCHANSFVITRIWRRREREREGGRVGGKIEGREEGWCRGEGGRVINKKSLSLFALQASLGFSCSGDILYIPVCTR